jgi:regulator of replication initiation timing
LFGIKPVFNRKLRERIETVECELAKVKAQIAELEENFGHIVGENDALRRESAQIQTLCGMSPSLPAIRRHRENWSYSAEPEKVQ